MVKVSSGYAPIAVFAYKRADHLASMFKTLAACKGFEESPITIFVDGPKSNADAEGVAGVRHFIETLRLPNVNFEFSDVNRGLKNAISNGVSKIAREHGRVIVLEDDLILSPQALRYFNQGLDAYADNPRVWSICGYMYAVPELRKRTTAFALPFAHPWGWATWHRAWEKFTLDQPDPPPPFGSRSFERAFNAPGTANYATMLKLTMEGKLSSWYIQWYYKILCEGGVSIFPPATYVRNEGFGRTGATHGSRLNPYRLLVAPQQLAQHAVEMPAQLVPDYRAMDVLRKSWDAKVRRMIAFMGSLKRRFR